MLPKSVLWSSSWPRSVHSVHPKLNKQDGWKVVFEDCQEYWLVSPPQHWYGWGRGELPPELLLWPHWLHWVLEKTHLSVLFFSEAMKTNWWWSWITKVFILGHLRPWGDKERQPYIRFRSAPVCCMPGHDKVSVTAILQGAGLYWDLHLHNRLQTFMMYFLVDMIMKWATSKVSNAFFIALHFIRRLLQKVLI